MQRKTHIVVRQGHCGHRKFCRAKVVHLWRAGRPLPREDKNLLRKIKMVPLPMGASPINAHSMHTDFRENGRFTYEFFAVLFSDIFAM